MHAGNAVSPDDVMRCYVDQGDREVLFLSRDDLLPVGREERVVRGEERLTRNEVARPGKLPRDPSLRINFEQPVVVLIDDQDRTRKNGRVRA